MAAELFEIIMEQCPRKKVISLCKKLIKKCSFKSGADCENLCHLAYWLYIYEQPTLSMKCVELTHDVPFDKNFNTWTFIHAMWGLEMRLLREQGKENEAQAIADTMNKHHLTPGKVDTPERMPQKEEKRRSRFTYEDAVKQEKIKAFLESGELNDANGWRFVALLRMIGSAETGFYPLLNESKARLEEKITEYISELQKIK